MLNLTISNLLVQGVRLSPFFINQKHLKLSKTTFQFFSNPMIYNSFGSFNQVIFKKGLSSAVKVSNLRRISDTDHQIRDEGSLTTPTYFFNTEWIDISASDHVFQFLDQPGGQSYNFANLSFTSCLFSGCKSTDGSILDVQTLNFYQNATCFFKNEAPKIINFQLTNELEHETRITSSQSLHMRVSTITLSNANYAIYTQCLLQKFNLLNLSTNSIQQSSVFYKPYKFPLYTINSVYSFEADYCLFANSTKSSFILEKQANSEDTTLTSFSFKFNQYRDNKAGEHGIIYSRGMENIIILTSFFYGNEYSTSPVIYEPLSGEIDATKKYIVVSACLFTNPKVDNRTAPGVEFSENNQWQQDDKRTFTYLLLNSFKCEGWELDNVELADLLGFKKQELVGLIIIILGIVALFIEIGYRMYKCCCFRPKEEIESEGDEIDKDETQNATSLSSRI